MKNSLLVHKHLIIRAEAVKPPVDEEILLNWLRDFIDAINMKVLMGPYVKYHYVPGNRGITGAAIIETSHIVMHVWDELGLAGFNKKNVKVQYKDGVLTVSGQVDDSEKEYLEKGLAARKFFKQFALHDKAVVNDARMEDGVLTIKLGVNEPEEIKPLDIEVK
jgi:HSP20 family molecular chaperone IbpA